MPMNEGTETSKRPAVLLAEDDEDVRIVFEMILSESYEIYAAETAAEAVQIATQHAIDVVLLDWTLPDASGEDVIRQLRAFAGSATIPIVIVSGLSSVASLARKHDALSCPKPCDAEQLLGAIEKALERRRS